MELAERRLANCAKDLQDCQALMVYWWNLSAESLSLCRDLYAEVGKGGDLDWHLCEQGYAERLRVLIEKADAD